jgi:membrane protease YdiL (CAAX protease family)
MPRSRFLLGGLLKLCLAAVCIVGAIAAGRLIIAPLIGAVFRLGPHALSLVRRTSIFIATVLAYWTFTRYYERREPKELALRFWWILLAAAAGALSIGITILALYATHNYQVVSVRGFGGFSDVFPQLWIAAVIEEIVFRAVLFRILEERLGTRVGLFGSAVIFCGAHVTNNGVRWVTLISVTLAGLMWALIYSAWRNVWVVAAHHCCWNAVIFMAGLPLSGEDWRLIAPFGSVSHGSILLTGGAFGPEDSLVNLVVSVGICVALWHIAAQRSKIMTVQPSSGELPNSSQQPTRGRSVARG